MAAERIKHIAVFGEILSPIIDHDNIAKIIIPVANPSIRPGQS